ncbi:rubredoxin domain-containing protein [Marinoscillum furvescens]|uniref:Rubredoxin n=1 Tax=Marinoscillum furvescens DSM 4134 TaxID=1122208 RepID=A0A3D9LG98_MARFU|nr:rubredoxin domain-containing protein [Marinoscillum furvescens]REE05627.1 rubredoxin [Marinoscillum furvescens DSM 4134]
MQVKDLVRIFVKGGIISPGEFLKLLLMAEKLGASHVHFGSRQDILFAAKEKSKEILDETFKSIQTEYEINSFEYQNILSSYVSQDILPGKKWLASHIYHYILNSFDYRTRLRVNVVDPSQSLVPLFTGQVNFIASGQENYWYVYLRFQHIQNAPWQMPLLVYTEDLVKIARALEDNAIANKDWSYREIFTFLTDNVKMNTQPVTENLVLPETHFPYYEGINRLPDGKYWLGLYWRDNKYRISTLKAIMERCIETEVGKVTLTPWKSFVIKGIFEKDRIGWEKLMGKFGMNLRHSSLELNWHLPALDQEALDLKFYLVRELDKQDISTYGLTFTIKTTPNITLFTSVVIEKCEEPETYNILYSKNFNPNLTDYQTYASKVHKSVLAALILELSLVYFEGMDEEKSPSPKVKSITENLEKDLYQCVHCQTVYDASYGDLEAGIEPGTAFWSLPSSYTCPTCGGSKEGYQKASI